jgi:hypothetical protein
VKIRYAPKRFGATNLAIVDHANEIIEEYQGAGLTLTLRQLYYQFVSRDLLPNTEKSYKNLGSVISSARLAGLVDWEAIEDRGRYLRERPWWNSPADIIDSAARSYHVDMWGDQDYRPEVWIEKEALVGVIEGVCNELSVPYFACKGYSSQSETWRAGRRMEGHLDNGQTPYVIHLGDHDPSGIDMTRDNGDRLELFAGQSVQVERIALNIDQVRRYNPPPNPTKVTDSRAEGYLKRFGHDCWELDALDPKLIQRLVREAITRLRDDGRWAEAQARKARDREALDGIVKKLKAGRGRR